ncbi:hypothetical protein [Pseudomonas savastanoi]|uniref:hypothetical protein n=1 Tax=Pseudomonas savastanoi TaxID=29438 RepID=UPI000E325AE7|nr:hypothetical protein [Pseudomonas savastanoi]
MSKVFYVPGDTAIIDYARELYGVYVAQHSGLMLAELHVRHPGAVLGNEESFLVDQERAFGTPPSQTTGARYDFALSQRKTLSFAVDSVGESFKLADYEVGNMTTIYARVGRRYWTFTGLATLPHHLIMRRVALMAYAGEPA